MQQALRPYPQYNGIDTYSGGGDHSGHSTYHAGILRFEKRYSGGLTFQTSYVFSKILTDSDTYWGSGQAADHYNRRLEKSIGQFDVTHNFKLGLVYDLPFGKGRAYLQKGPAAWIIGNWRISSVNLYSSGQPVGISTSYGLPLFNRQKHAVHHLVRRLARPNEGRQLRSAGGQFLRSLRRRGPFPDQGLNTPLNQFGNVDPLQSEGPVVPELQRESVGYASFPIKESVRLEFRAEAFNVLNRVRFGTGSTQIQSQNFGHLTSFGRPAEFAAPAPVGIEAVLLTEAKLSGLTGSD